MTFSNLIVYDQACAAVARAASVDEAKEIADKAEAIRIYALKASNRKLEIDAAEIRVRAERRLGQILRAQKDIGALSKGGRPAKGKTSGGTTLRTLGITNKLSSRAQQLAAGDDDSFERQLTSWRRDLEETGLRARSPMVKGKIHLADRDKALKLLSGRKLAAVAVGELPSLAKAALAEFKLLQALIEIGQPASALSCVGDFASAGYLETLRRGAAEAAADELSE